MALQVLDDFPGANVRVLELRPAPHAELLFTADPHGGPEALWFNFRLEDIAPPDPIPDTLTLSLRFFDNLLGGGGDPAACRPVMRIAQKNWRRLRAPTFHRLDDGQSELQWPIPYPVERTEIAVTHPYTPDELHGLIQRSHGYWRETAIGLTQNGRTLHRLDNREHMTKRNSPVRGLYLLARQHAGEAPGSWVLDGLLDTLSRRRSGTPWVAWAIPFVDLDGVLAGDYGKDAFPCDLNRAWGSPPMRHETLVIQRDMQRWSTVCQPQLVLDLHAPGIAEQDGVYLFHDAGGEETPADRDEKAWINIFQQALTPEFGADRFARVATHGSRWETPRVTDFVRKSFGCTALSIEIPYALCKGAVMTPKQYRDVGRALAGGILNRW